MVENPLQSESVRKCTLQKVGNPAKIPLLTRKQVERKDSTEGRMGQGLGASQIFPWFISFYHA
ncbi:hypothetical protein Bbelb_104050, partial [Branchiostoma belcheri]